jgi:hypothetical protein
VTKAQLREFTSWLGKRSYRARLERLGLELIQQIAREKGKKSGRPRVGGKHRQKGALQ